MSRFDRDHSADVVSQFNALADRSGFASLSVPELYTNEDQWVNGQAREHDGRAERLHAHRYAAELLCGILSAIDGGGMLPAIDESTGLVSRPKALAVGARVAAEARAERERMRATCGESGPSFRCAGLSLSLEVMLERRGVHAAAAWAGAHRMVHATMERTGEAEGGRGNREPEGGSGP